LNGGGWADALGAKSYKLKLAIEPRDSLTKKETRIGRVEKEKCRISRSKDIAGSVPEGARINIPRRIERTRRKGVLLAEKKVAKEEKRGMEKRSRKECLWRKSVKKKKRGEVARKKGEKREFFPFEKKKARTLTIRSLPRNEPRKVRKKCRLLKRGAGTQNLKKTREECKGKRGRKERGKKRGKKNETTRNRRFTFFIHPVRGLNFRRRGGAAHWKT